MRLLFFLSVFIFCSCGILQSQVNPALSQLNRYKNFVIKEENSVSDYKDSISKKVQDIFKKAGFPKPLDPSVLYSNQVDQCGLITLVYSVIKSSHSTGEITCMFKFVDCNNTSVFSNTTVNSYQFTNEKNYIKSIVKCFAPLTGFAYQYAAAVKDENVALSGTPPVSPPAEIAIAPPSQYRGGGDPLKGINVARPPKLTFGRYYALLVGVDKYKGTWPSLQNAVNDAEAIDTLLRNYRFDVIHQLYNEQATREKIISEFEWLVAHVGPEDNVFIYYSGHGEYKQELRKGYWIPADAATASVSGFISNNDIQTFLTGIKSKHTLLVSDACFSGDIFRGSTISVPFEESEKYYKEVNSRASRQAITSGGIEPVMDGGRNGHSVFAYYFLKTLTENKSPYFDASQLFEKIKIPVINNSEQTPKFSPVKDTGDEGGQFIFIKK